MFPDGSFLVPQTDQDSQTRALSATAAGVYPVEATVSVTKPDGEPSGWTLPVHSSRMIMTTGGDQPISTYQPFAPSLRLTVWGEGFVYGWADSYEFRVFNRVGALQLIVRRAVDRAPVSAEDREWFADGVFHMVGEDEIARQLSKGLIFPDHYAAYDRLLVDRIGDLWVRRFDPRAALQAVSTPSPLPTEWDVFDASGRWLTTVALPGDVVIHDIGEDYVLGVWKDEMDVQYVRMYGLER